MKVDLNEDEVALLPLFPDSLPHCIHVPKHRESVGNPFGFSDLPAVLHIHWFVHPDRHLDFELLVLGAF